MGKKVQIGDVVEISYSFLGIPQTAKGEVVEIVKEKPFSTQVKLRILEGKELFDKDELEKIERGEPIFYVVTDRMKITPKEVC